MNHVEEHVLLLLERWILAFNAHKFHHRPTNIDPCGDDALKTAHFAKIPSKCTNIFLSRMDWFQITVTKSINIGRLMVKLTPIETVIIIRSIFEKYLTLLLSCNNNRKINMTMDRPYIDPLRSLQQVFGRKHTYGVYIVWYIRIDGTSISRIQLPIWFFNNFLVVL